MKSIRLYLTMAVSLLVVACGGGGGSDTGAVDPETAAVPEGYSLVWADEFDADGLPDPSRWDYDTDRNRLGWYNGEQQYYARDRPENAQISAGRLVITARKENLSALPDWGGQAYSSARLITRGKATWTHGHFEIRAKLPCGGGTWPAIWMLAESGRWPTDGEIDIMEHVGNTPDRVFSALHSTRSGDLPPAYSIRLPDACTAFHNYYLTWTADSITMGVDGVPHYQATRGALGQDAWPFDVPQYLLLNVAVGGSLGGAVNPSAFPDRMEVDYVRVYQKSAAAPAPVVTPNPPPVAPAEPVVMPVPDTSSGA
jgi:beta-glucanase (GH16 family)